MGFFGGWPDKGLHSRLDRIERQVQALLDHFQIELPNDGLDEVRQLAAAGKKIPAIKLYRQITGAGLAEAKEVVERGL
jgi:ribosomal protein L7/L12